MKLWMALPKEFSSARWAECERCTFRYSSAAMCPPLTMEMEQDGLRWFEVEVLGEVNPRVKLVGRA